MKNINYFRAGNVQYVYGITDNDQYYCMKYDNKKAIDTGRNISEIGFPTTPKKDYKYFSTEEELYAFLDEEAANNLDHIMWPLTPVKWVKPYQMIAPEPYFKIKLQKTV